MSWPCINPFCCQDRGHRGPCEPYPRCNAKHPAEPMRCIRDKGHLGQHGYAGIFWDEPEDPDRALKESAWAEGYEAGLADGYVHQSDATPNPYRAKTKESTHE